MASPSTTPPPPVDRIAEQLLHRFCAEVLQREELADIERDPDAVVEARELSWLGRTALMNVWSGRW